MRACVGCGVGFKAERRAGKPQKYHSVECRRAHQHGVEKRARARHKNGTPKRRARLGSKANPLIAVQCPSCRIIYSAAAVPAMSEDAVCRVCRALRYVEERTAAA